MKLENLLQTIGTAVQDAYKAIEDDAAGRFFDNYFERSGESGGDITYTPKIIQVEIPSPEPGGKGKKLYAPAAALVQHKNLNLDCVKVSLNIEAAEETDGGLQVSVQGPRGQKEGESPKNAGILEITLKCSEAAEGIARIETRLYGML